MSQERIAELLKALRKDATTPGITTGTGLNFFNLETQAKAIYPVFYPLLASIPRIQPMVNGVKVGGTGVNWKAITSIDAGGYPATSEGNRNAFMQYTEKDYFAPFRYLGKETNVSFPAERTGEGFNDNLGTAQISLLNALLNDEERMILYGNSGPNGTNGGNGYALGTTPTPVASLVASGAIANAVNCSFRCIALTPWGVQMASTTGAKLPFSRANADGSTDTINGGTGVLSASSAVVVTGSGNNSVKGVVAAVVGAVGYAWYLDSTDATTPAAANAVFCGVTSIPTITVTVLPNGANQKANASNATGDFTTDRSFNALDMDGLMTWGFNYAGASTPSYVLDLNGANLTTPGDGTINEWEAALDFFYSNYKITPDRVYLGGTLIDAVSKRILGAGNANAVTKLNFTRDDAGNLVGGSFSVAYRSKYGGGQMKQLDVISHPWLPNGTILFDLINNPYPAAGNAIPTVRRIVTLEDHFSIKWPYSRLRHEVGVYAFQTMQHYLPFGIGILTGVGNG